MGRVKRQEAAAGNRRQPPYAFGPAGWALVDFGVALGYGIGVRGAIRVPAACALRLGQGRQNPGCITRHSAIFCG